MKEKDSGKEKMGEKKIYITPIKEGTAIDHLAPGNSCNECWQQKNGEKGPYFH
ncbi:MAG: hypothetical protein J4224_02240 [Candidatus Diapherotrites archaeon]|uniref:Uncharacterized protein n=1 Tax=Candidatus Iainarchaeum sp. TaxID=3101447 RepID=A0A8T4KYS3_9ARCH|nr:hypothetical protein [Candidatus Diapherotrites archaeon]